MPGMTQHFRGPWPYGSVTGTMQRNTFVDRFPSVLLRNALGSLAGVGLVTFFLFRDLGVGVTGADVTSSESSSSLIDIVL